MSANGNGKTEVKLINLEGTPLDGMMESADPKVRDAFQRLKLSFGGVDPYRFLRDVASLGQFVKNTGMRDLVRGSALVVQAKMFMGINLMEDSLDHYKDRTSSDARKQRRLIMDAIAGYCEIINKSQEILLKTEGTLAGLPPGTIDLPDPTRESFKPGQEVRPPQTTPTPPTPATPPQPAA